MASQIHFPMTLPTPLYRASGAFREAQPFGPDGRGGFATALVIEVDPASGAKACAVADGRIRYSGNTLLLQPTPAALEDLSDALNRDGALLFLYRDLDGASLDVAVGGVLTDGAATRTIASGAPLGQAGAGGVGGWSRLGFEILFVPRGLDLDDALSFARLCELGDPAALTRRLDPAAFYAPLVGGSAAVIALEHRAHPLRTALDRRSLVEIRDEYDLPFAGPITLSIDGGAPREVVAPTGSRGTFVVATDGAVSVEVIAAGHVLTLLPSDIQSSPSFCDALAAPSHVALQALFMEAAPTAADEEKSWFAPNTSPRRRFTAENRVTPIRDGLDVFDHYQAAIRTACRPGDSIYLAGWFLDDGFPLLPGDAATTFHALSTVAATEGAEVYALLWDQTFRTNSDEVRRINELPFGRGAAVLDGDTLDVGSHHQKFLIVDGSEGTFAFAGGVDINPDRLDSPAHGAPGAFHDVQLKVEGPAVEDLRRTFVDRWNSHPAHAPLPLEAPPVPPVGSAFVQIACTYPPRKKYSFAPAGALDPLAAVVRAVRKAKRYVYIEDQYLTPYSGMDGYEAKFDLGLVEALREALPRIEALIMVVPNHTDQPSGRLMRAQFLSALYEVAREKVHVFYMKRHSPHPTLPSEIAPCKEGPRSGMTGNPDEIYCHSKTWIVDDIIARVGSANCCRRSYTHDSELDVVTVDGAVEDGVRAFARRLRVELWQEILRLPDPAILDDYRRALAFWRAPPPGALIARYDPSAELLPTVADHAALLLDDVARFLGVPPERVAGKAQESVIQKATEKASGKSGLLGEALAAGDEAVRAVESAVDGAIENTSAYLKYDPVVTWSIVDPDGR